MKTIAIIPARGGSKRFPDKNLKLLGKNPLLKYSIDFAINNNDIIDEVYVTSDSPRIKELSISLGAKTIDRPVELSLDQSPTIEAIQHALTIVEGKVDHVVILQPTNPLRPQSLMADAWRAYIDSGVNSLMTVSRDYKKYGTIVNNQYRPTNYKMGQRSQDLTPQYYENGLLYIVSSETIYKGKILDDHNFAFVVNNNYAEVDIDTPDDLHYAEFLLNKIAK